MYNILYLPFTITEKKRTSLVTSNDSKIVHYFIVVLEQLIYLSCRYRIK